MPTPTGTKGSEVHGKCIGVPGGTPQARPQKGPVSGLAASFQSLPLPGSVSWVWPDKIGPWPSWLASRWIWDRQLGYGLSRSEEVEAGDGAVVELEPWLLIPLSWGGGVRASWGVFGGGL